MFNATALNCKLLCQRLLRDSRLLPSAPADGPLLMPVLRLYFVRGIAVVVGFHPYWAVVAVAFGHLEVKLGQLVVVLDFERGSKRSVVFLHFHHRDTCRNHADLLCRGVRKVDYAPAAAAVSHLHDDAAVVLQVGDLQHGAQRIPLVGARQAVPMVARAVAHASAVHTVRIITGHTFLLCGEEGTASQG